MKPSKLVFLCGSSAVGKTSLLNAFPDTVFDDVSDEAWKVIKVKMDVTSIRQELGNPSWEDLMRKPDVAAWQQAQIMEIYRQRITEIKDREDRGIIYLFERCELDVNGYSWAFGAPRMSLNDMVFTRTNYYLIHRPLDPTVPYALTVNRPPEIIRDDCATYLHGITHRYGAYEPLHSRAGELKLRIGQSPTFAYRVEHSHNTGEITKQLNRITDFIFD